MSEIIKFKLRYEYQETESEYNKLMKRVKKNIKDKDEKRRHRRITD